MPLSELPGSPQARTRRRPDGRLMAALGGFSGRESQVSLDWLADAVESGQVRWVLTDAS